MDKIKDFEENLQLSACFLFQFNSFSEWVSKAPRVFYPYKFGYHTICLDKHNSVCHIGEDFMKARTEDLFPVKVYALKRTINSEFNSQKQPQ